ncbi:NUDIX domain-containing protein [Pontibacter virosus]|uniref:ADP-ribose pyrophosphatase YjhB (NUDIX family) n=1 Tax=Pontibacter virosus TaxID=1765052 RepID=A0A2U1B139_9BACT|nr:NUDIX hydrolase [Pontibacter virosus]PVY42396.1 ADP-ribose pyrophosphatase YjhB (NUDIX family) [Pontibacter virosus]
MNTLNPNAAAYAGKVRLRVCGICLQDNKLLLVRHQPTLNNVAFWAPPGGGLQYGETVEACLVREVLEETGLHTKVKRFLFVNEFLEKPLQAVELFFELEVIGGELVRGIDPEASAEQQLIEEVAFLSLEEIRQIPLADKHSILHYLFSLDDLFGLPHRFVQA